MAKEVGERAQSQFETTLAALWKANPPPKDPVDRVTALSGLENQANELVMSELLVRDEETAAAESNGYSDHVTPKHLRLQSPKSATSPDNRN